MNSLRYIYLLLFFLSWFWIPAIAQQTRFSLATDFSVLRSWKKQQQYWSIGQTVAGHFHFTPKDGGFIWLTYNSNGSFKNQLNATAKSPVTSPQQIGYTNRAKMSFRHISFGWKHYFIGTYNKQKGGNLYGYAGLGLMMGRIENLHSVHIDTADYSVPVLPGKSNFKRLTSDLGLGYERHMGGDVFFYFEGRTIIPLTDYPSNYIFINKYAPLTASVNIGVRVLFDL